MSPTFVEARITHATVLDVRRTLAKAHMSRASLRAAMLLALGIADRRAGPHDKIVVDGVVLEHRAVFIVVDVCFSCARRVERIPPVMRARPKAN